MRPAGPGADFLFAARIAAVYSGLPTGGRSMFCIYCGTSIPKDALFCSACGRATAHGSEGVPAPGETPQPAAAVEVPAAVVTARAAEAASPTAISMAVPPAAPAARKGIGPILWVLGGVVVLVLGLGLWSMNRGSNDGSSSDSGTSSYTPAPTPQTPPADPAPQIVDDTPPVESTPAPAPAPEPAPAPQNNSIVGTWKTPTALGETTMELGADGRYTVKGTFVNDYGVYVYSSDGSLRLQSQNFFDGSLVTWRCQINGDTMSVIEQTGAAHIYTRVN